MKYRTGETIKVGDNILVARQHTGTVVCSMDTGEYTDDFPEADWSYLKKGMMIQVSTMGLVHVDGEDGTWEDIDFVSRKDTA